MPISVTYRFPAGVDAAKQGKVIAVGQTAGSWDERFAAQAPSLQAHLAEVAAVWSDESGRGHARVEFPDCDLQGDLGSLLTLIFGKFSMAGAAKVVGLELPDALGTKPRFGMSGLRQLVGVPENPLVMAIFKPALGLSADDHATILAEVATAGIDVVKDDEIMADLPAAPTRERVRACRKALEVAARTTGRMPLYAVNVTGRADQLLTQARALVAEGANALLVNGLAHGLSVVEALATDEAVKVPIFLHPSLAGAWCGAPDHGFSYGVLLGTLAAHSGADAVLYPAHYGSLPFAAADEFAIRDALRLRGVAPVPSAGIHPGVVPRVGADYGQDVVLNAGTGIMDHPDGPAAGVAAMHRAVARLRMGHPAGTPFDPGQLTDVADGPLVRALAKWGRG